MAAEILMTRQQQLMWQGWLLLIGRLKLAVVAVVAVVAVFML